MRNQLALATTTALAMALAACGDPPEADVEEDTAAIEELMTEDAVDDAAQGDTAENGEAIEDAAEAEAEAEVEPEPAASATPAPSPTPTQVAAAGPPAAFTTCGVCHAVEPGVNLVGPTLAGVVGRQSGAVAGANYSPAMQSANITWNESNLRRYLADPAAVVPGGTMPNPGLDAAQTQAVVNYLKTL